MFNDVPFQSGKLAVRRPEGHGPAPNPLVEGGGVDSAAAAEEGGRPGNATTPAPRLPVVGGWLLARANARQPVTFCAAQDRRRVGARAQTLAGRTEQAVRGRVRSL